MSQSIISNHSYLLVIPRTAWKAIAFSIIKCRNLISSSIIDAYVTTLHVSFIFIQIKFYIDDKGTLFTIRLDFQIHAAIFRARIKPCGIAIEKPFCIISDKH